MAQDPESLKVESLVEAARQRLNLALNRESWLARQQHTIAADELLAEVQKVLRIGASPA